MIDLFFKTCEKHKVRRVGDMSTVRNLSQESLRVITSNKGLQIRDGLENEYPDIYTDEVVDALKALSVFNKDQKMLMEKRYATRAQRFRNKERSKMCFHVL